MQRPQVRLSRAARPRPQAFQAARREGRGLLLEPEARALVASYGVPLVPGRFCASAAEAAAAADEYAGPVALKVVSRSISHKTEAGGVLLDVRGALAARRGYARLRQRAVAHLAGADGARGFEGVLVTRMLPPPTAELLVGARRDEQFGPILTIGLGGTAVELLREVAIRPLPLSRAEVLEMLQGGRIDRALAGLRGRPAASREALASLALHLADCLLANPEIAELECNPVFAGPGAAVAVDVRLVLQEPRRGARQRDREPVRLRRRAAGA